MGSSETEAKPPLASKPSFNDETLYNHKKLEAVTSRRSDDDSKDRTFPLMPDDSQAYSLSWKEFPTNLISFFRELQDLEELVDVTLACEGRQIFAHKVVLAASSPFFRKLLKSNPCQHPIIILNEVRYSELAPMLHYMYHGEVHIHYDQITDFLRTARLLQVRGLTGESSPSTPENVQNIQRDRFSEVSEIVRKSKDRERSPSQERSRSKSPELKRPRITNSHDSTHRSRSSSPVCSPNSPVHEPPEALCPPTMPLPIPGLSIPLSLPSSIASLTPVSVSLHQGLSPTVHAPFPQLFPQNSTLSQSMANCEDTSDTCASDKSDDRPRHDVEDEEHETSLEKMSSLANMAALKGLAGFPGPSGLVNIAAGTGMVPNADHSVGRQRFDFYRVRATDPRPCHLCGKIYKNAHTLRTHMEDKHSNCNGFRCVLCGTVAKSRNSLHSHMSRQHRGISTKDLPLLPMPAPWNPEMASKYIQLVGGVGEVVRQNYRRTDRDLSNGRDGIRENTLGSDASTPTSQENGTLSPYLKPELDKERRVYDSSFPSQLDFSSYGTKASPFIDAYLQVMRASGVDIMHNMNEKAWEDIRQNAAPGRGVLDLTRGSPHQEDDTRGSDHFSDDENPVSRANDRSTIVDLNSKSPPPRLDNNEESKWPVQ